MRRVGPTVEGECLVDIAGCYAVPQSVIDDAFLLEESMFLGKRIGCGGGRLDVRHVKHIGHTACRCRTAFACNVSLLRQPRFTKMDVRVDDTRQEPSWCLPAVGSLLYLCYASICSDDQIPMDQMTFGKDADIAYNFG